MGHYIPGVGMNCLDRSCTGCSSVVHGMEDVHRVHCGLK